MMLEVHSILFAVVVLGFLFYGLGMLTCWWLVKHLPEKRIINPARPKIRCIDSLGDL